MIVASEGLSETSITTEERRPPPSRERLVDPDGAFESIPLAANGAERRTNPIPRDNGPDPRYVFYTFVDFLSTSADRTMHGYRFVREIGKGAMSRSARRRTPGSL
jgi:hypothetical protein